MSTVATRMLGLNDVKDTVAIKVNGDDYADLSGVIKVRVTSYTPSVDTEAVVDIRSPRYNPNADTPIVDNVHVTTSVLVAVNKDYYISVNNGVVGPSARVQPDGTWDLLNIKYETALGSTNNDLTVVYTVTWLPYESFGGSPTVDTFTLNTAYNKLYDRKDIGLLEGDYDTYTGCVAVKVISAANVTAVTNQYVGQLNGTPPDGIDFGSPLLVIMTMPKIGTLGKGDTIEMYSISKTSGTKTFDENVSDQQPHANVRIYAVNSGKMDVNAQLVKSTSVNYYGVMSVQQLTNPIIPTKDTVTTTVTYSTLKQTA